MRTWQICPSQPRVRSGMLAWEAQVPCLLLLWLIFLACVCECVFSARTQTSRARTRVNTRVLDRPLRSERKILIWNVSWLFLGRDVARNERISFLTLRPSPLIERTRTSRCFSDSFCIHRPCTHIPTDRVSKCQAARAKNSDRHSAVFFTPRHLTVAIQQTNSSHWCTRCRRMRTARSGVGRGRKMSHSLSSPHFGDQEGGGEQGEDAQQLRQPFLAVSRIGTFVEDKIRLQVLPLPPPEDSSSSSVGSVTKESRRRGALHENEERLSISSESSLSDFEQMDIARDDIGGGSIAPPELRYSKVLSLRWPCS